MKTIILLLCSVLLLQCETSTNKEKLVDAFVDLRKIHSNVISVAKKGDYEIAFQDESDVSENHYYPNNYSIGKLSDSKNDYEYVVHVKGISPFEEFEYVKAILNRFESDSTYTGALIKEDTSVKVNIYRKANNINDSKLDFMMWKWVQSPYGKFDFEIKEIMNEHLFEK